ncbi:hypothetical protein, partial [Georgenia yuyongxinii]
MNERPDPREESALERLRRADPAAATTPDLERLRSAVDARIAADAAAGPGVAPSSGPGVAPDDSGAATSHGAVTDLAAVRARRSARARWLQVAAAVAGVAVVGTAGFALGRAEAPA